MGYGLFFSVIAHRLRVPDQTTDDGVSMVAMKRKKAGQDYDEDQKLLHQVMCRLCKLYCHQGKQAPTTTDSLVYM